MVGGGGSVESLTRLLTPSRLGPCLPQNHFLQAFPSVPAPKAGGVKTSTGGGGLLGLWLRLLVNLSFAEDGQQSVLKVPEALDVLADLAQQRRLALLTLHNLCFCPANKPHVIANGTAADGGGEVESRNGKIH